MATEVRCRRASYLTATMRSAFPWGVIRTVMPCPLALDKQQQYWLTRKVEAAREQFAVGSTWVFRDGRRFTEARVRKVEQPKGPVRVQVDLLDDHYVGERRWVPTTSLPVPWDCRSDWLQFEAAWDAVCLPEQLDTTVEHAITCLFEKGLPEGAIGYSGFEHAGVTLIRDPQTVANVTALSLADFDVTTSFETAEGVVVPWSVTEHVAVALVAVEDGRIAQDVIDELRLPPTMKERLRSRRTTEQLVEMSLVSPAALDDPFDMASVHEPVIEVIRRWMGERVGLTTRLEVAVEREGRFRDLLRRALGELEPTRTQKCARLTDEIRLALGLPEPPWKRR